MMVADSSGRVPHMTRILGWVGMPALVRALRMASPSLASAMPSQSAPARARMGAQRAALWP